jgi:hypothetical protein
MSPAARVHQPSIAHAAHEVVFDLDDDRSSRRAAQSVSGQYHESPEHAHTGTSAVEYRVRPRPPYVRGAGRPASPAELVIVDLIAQQNEQPHEEPGDGDFAGRPR